MLIAGVIALCIVLAVLAFLAPRLSRHPQRGASAAFGKGGQGASKAPGKLGHWLSKPFRSSQKAVNRSAEGGRRGRGKLPL
jgi:hypothetical protein